jgi:hypothetical protein
VLDRWQITGTDQTKQKLAEILDDFGEICQSQSW